MFRRSGPRERIEIAPVAFTVAPAKTWAKPDGTVGLGRSVWEHCQIVGEVAKALIARFPQRIRDKLFPPGSHLCSACHDIGKISPTFVVKILKAAAVDPASWHPAFSGIDPAIESNWGGHAGVSEVAASAMGAGPLVPEILGQHHGFSPQVAIYSADAELFGGAGWQRERARLVDALTEILGAGWPTVTSLAQARAISGLTSVADWIGSGKFFEDPRLDWRANIGSALDDAGFIHPSLRPGLQFADVFGFPPRPAQAQLVSVATQPGVYVLEAPMGMGKTEAALYAAYQSMAQGEATGIYFALPTQLTSNKIHDRFNRFLEAILAPDCVHRRALLLHADAWLVETEMGEDAKPGGSWFTSSKRGLLAPFAVGTIDQALMAAMNVKHGFVRAFGLAGKVVILDEVHTYDAYTGTILEALVALLREMDCVVIILSATLSHQRREALLQKKLSSRAYPLITAASNEQVLTELDVPGATGTTVNVTILADVDRAMDEALQRAGGGQQVLWIENTVTHAQERFLDFAARCTQLGVECGLLHSRFTKVDRQDNEERWVTQYGQAGWPERGFRGRILVGTQVLEQSLDIDTDFLVTRFAPTDMLLQRLGRLWRHAGAPRPAEARPDAWVLAPELDAAIASPHEQFGLTASVYSPYVLCRSLEVWTPLTTIALPTDIRSLIEATYFERAESGPMAQWLHELDHGDRRRWQGRVALTNLARLSLSMQGKTLPESKAQTRYSDSESVDLLLLREMTIVTTERLSRLVLLDGSQLDLPWSQHRLDKRAWRKLSAQLMRQVLHCPINQAPVALPRHHLEKLGLQHCCYLGNQTDGEALLRVALVSATGELRSLDGGVVHGTRRLNYRATIGLRCENQKE